MNLHGIIIHYPAIDKTIQVNHEFMVVRVVSVYDSMTYGRTNEVLASHLTFYHTSTSHSHTDITILQTRIHVMIGR